MAVVGIEWGTVGEWVGGLGALAAVVTALWLERRARRRDDAQGKELEQQRALLRAVESLDFRVRYEISPADVYVPGEVFPETIYEVVEVTNTGRSPFFDFECVLTRPGPARPLFIPEVRAKPNHSEEPSVAESDWVQVTPERYAALKAAEDPEDQRPDPHPFKVRFRDEDGVRFVRDERGQIRTVEHTDPA